MIRVTCPCGQTLQTGDEHAGKVIRCPQCQGQLTVPSGQEDDFVPVAMVEAVRPGPAPYSAAPPISRERREREERGPRRGAYTTPDATSGKAVLSLILGILALVSALVLGILAPIWSAAIPATVGLIALGLALFAMGDLKRSQGRLGGHGLALIGLIVGVLAIPMYFPGYMIKAQNQRRNAAVARLMETNNLKQIGLAFHNYASGYGGKLPEPANLDPTTGKPLLSWRVHILPYIEQDHLYRQFHLNEPWDSPHNLQLLQRMPAIYGSAGRPAEPNQTTYQMLVGPNTLYTDWPPKNPGFPARRFRIGNIPDGTSNTFFVVESSNPVLWTKPEDITNNPQGPPPALGWSMPDRFLALLGDGSVRTVQRSLSGQTLRLLIDPADNQVVPWEALD